MPNIKLSVDVIKSLPLTCEWEPVEGIVEKTGSKGTGLPSWREIFAIGKLSEGEHVLLIFAKHSDLDQWDRDLRWHLYVNGLVAWRMTNEDGHASSSTKIDTIQAMRFADIYIKSDNMRFSIKFDRELSLILQKYRKTHDVEN